MTDALLRFYQMVDTIPDNEPFTTIGGDIELRHNTATHELTIIRYPDDDVRDADGDRCRSGFWRIEHAIVRVSQWPTITVSGFLRQWRSSDDVLLDRRGEPYYTPRPNEQWEPAMVVVEIEPQ